MASNLPEPVYVEFYRLTKPIEWGGETITQLNWMEPIAQHHISVEESKGGPIQKMCYFIHLLTNQPIGLIKLLSHKDYLACQEILMRFLDPGQKTTTEA